MQRRTFVVAGIAAWTAGCGGPTDDDAGPPVRATLLTSYGLRGRDAYAYVAQERGYFRAAGFDVTIEPGRDLVTNLRRLQSGGPVFAALDLTACLLAAAIPPEQYASGQNAAAQSGTGPNAAGSNGAGPNGAAPNGAGPGAAVPAGAGPGRGGPGGGTGPGGSGPGGTGPGATGPGGGGPGGGGMSGFGFLAAIHQRTTAAILAPGGGSIGAPRDLGGKTLGEMPGSTVRALFPTYCRLAGVEARRTGWVDATPQAMAGALARGRVAGVGDTVAGRRAVEAATHGRTAVVLAYSDQLQDLYGDALVTSTAYAKAQPRRARKFAAALLRGLAEAIDDPAAAGAIMHRYVPAVTAQAAAAELTLLAPYIRSAAEGLPVGALDANRVARGIAVLQGAGQIAPGLTPDRLVL